VSPARNVEIGAESSVWYGAVVRGDVHCVRIPARWIALGVPARPVREHRAARGRSRNRRA
jgi:carbonic anhydrase/acetyltransferase-like protein (isoleucine patch superfamily)